MCPFLVRVVEVELQQRQPTSRAQRPGCWFAFALTLGCHYYELLLTNMCRPAVPCYCVVHSVCHAPSITVPSLCRWRLRPAKLSDHIQFTMCRFSLITSSQPKSCDAYWVSQILCQVVKCGCRDHPAGYVSSSRQHCALMQHTSAAA